MARRHGYSLVDLMVSLALVSILAGASLPRLSEGRRVALGRAAADHVAGRLHLARVEALKRHANVAVRWEGDGTDCRLAFYQDGNGNGVRSTDIATGMDTAWLPSERLSDQFPGMTFRLGDDVPTVDGDDNVAGTEGVRFGKSRMASWSAAGTASSGTVYLSGPRGPQLAVRVLGATGRIRTMEFDAVAKQWRPR